MQKIIILGMNRSGTKLASFLVAKSFSLKNVFLEPFTWNKGIDASLSDTWQPQQQLRSRCDIAKNEHQQLNIISSAEESSSWLDSLVNSEKWDVIKFIEIGRYNLYERYSEDAFFISLIRDPIELLQSIKGMDPARDAVVEQWRRLKEKEGYDDPLPDANNYLSSELADCARAYAVLYKKLSRFSPKHGMKVSYQDLITNTALLKPIEHYLNSNMLSIEAAPLLGGSTKKALTDAEVNYITKELQPIYHDFLN